VKWIDAGPTTDWTTDSHLIPMDGGYRRRTSGESYFAVEDICTHDGAQLTGGTIEGMELLPRHGARFCLRTGER